MKNVTLSIETSNDLISQQPYPEQNVLLVNLGKLRAFHSFNSQEARKAIQYIEKVRSGTEPSLEEKHFLLNLFEKGVLTQPQLVEKLNLSDERTIRKDESIQKDKVAPTAQQAYNEAMQELVHDLHKVKAAIQTLGLTHAKLEKATKAFNTILAQIGQFPKGNF